MLRERSRWRALNTTRAVHEDTVHLWARGKTSFGELGFGGAPAAFSSGPSDVCIPAPEGVAGARCACELLPPLAKPAEIACGKLAQASVETKAQARLAASP